jgi:FPC/CPF motif-containing protein YcgG
MKFDPTLFYKGLADDLIEYISYHDGEETVINFLLKLGYTPEELIENVSFNEKDVEEVVQKTVEKTVRNYFGLDDE